MDSKFWSLKHDHNNICGTWYGFSDRQRYECCTSSNKYEHLETYRNLASDKKKLYFCMIFLLDNPKCESGPGCGEWKRPQIKNPKYKGKWYAPTIDNPNYKVRLFCLEMVWFMLLLITLNNTLYLSDIVSCDDYVILLLTVHSNWKRETERKKQRLLDGWRQMGNVSRELYGDRWVMFSRVVWRHLENVFPKSESFMIQPPDPWAGQFHLYEPLCLISTTIHCALFAKAFSQSLTKKTASLLSSITTWWH